MFLRMKNTPRYRKLRNINLNAEEFLQKILFIFPEN